MEHMEELMKFDEAYLLTTSDFRKLDGKTGRKTVKSFFNENFIRDTPKTDEYEF